MTVYDLTREQLIDLKQSMLCAQGSPSWGELAEADELVPDDAVYSEFDGIEFTEDDFFCTDGE